MYSIQKLAIAGYRGEPVPHTLFRQQAESQHAALIFAGRGVNCQHPTLYYPTGELLRRGADVLLVDYCLRPGFSTLTDEELMACVQADTLAAYHALFQQRSYQQLTLIGKSLGTLAMGSLLASVPAMPRMQAIWLTPLLKLPALCAQIQQARPASLFVIGTADPYYDASILADLAGATAGQTLVIEEADHSLEVPGGIDRSLQVMEQIMQNIQTFLDRA